MTSTYDSRTGNAECSLVARGDLWRIEASQESSTSGTDSSLFLVQLGRVLFVRDSALLLPVSFVEAASAVVWIRQEGMTSSYQKLLQIFHELVPKWRKNGKIF